MRRLAGQVAGGVVRGGGRGLSLLLRLAMLLALVVGVAALALAWRLAQGPLSMPAVTRMVEARVADAVPGLRLRIREVSVAWAGWREGAPHPVSLRLEGLRAEDASGAERAALGTAEVSLSLPALLGGRPAPIRVVLRDPVVTLLRDPEGRLTLDLGEGPGGAGPEADLLDAVLDPPPGSPLAELEEVVLRGGSVRIRDEQLDLAWSLEGPDLTLRRTPEGLDLAGGAALRLGEETVPVRVTGRARGRPAVLEAALDLAAIRPAALAAARPVLRPAEALEAPVSARFEVRYHLDGGALAARVEVRAGPGQVIAGGRRAPFTSLEAVLSGDGRHLVLERAEAVIPAPRPGAEPTRLLVSGAARREGSVWRGRAEARLDRLDLRDLAALWPPGVSDGARDWVAENLTGGTARDGRWWAEAEIGEDFAGARLLDLGGEVRAEGAVIHWLRPIPPATAAEAVVTFSPGEIAVRAREARQGGTALRVAEARIRLHDLEAAVEQAAIELRVAGPLAEVLGLVRHPRLRLFERRPLDLRGPGGAVEASLSLAFPLVADLAAEDVRVRARGRVTNGRLADLVAGQPVERANLDVTLDQDGMRLTGSAFLGPVPASRATVEIDFRPGPPGAASERVRAEGRAEAADLAAFGLEGIEAVATGPLAYTAQVERRRSGETRAVLRAQLRDARLDLGALGPGKPAGVPGTAEATLVVQGDSLRTVEGLRVEAPGLLARGRVVFEGDSRLARVELAEARVARSRLSGTILPPERPGGAWQASLRGPALDLRPALSRGAGGDGDDSPPLDLDLAVERVLVAETGGLGPARAVVSLGRGGRLVTLRASGRAPGGGPFEAALAPRDGRRLVDLASEDAGGLLRGLGLTDTVDGGRLRLIGGWTAGAPDGPLTGTLEMWDFGLRDAPALGKFLQAVTVYGLPEAAAGPGLRFARLIAPFTLTEDAVTLRDAQAFSASLGVTLRGRLLRREETLDLQGTLVPAYLFNSLLGRLPLLGRLFSPEAGGGLFAATFRATGPLADPEIRVNPLAALTPGALRRLFGALDAAPQR